MRIHGIRAAEFGQPGFEFEPRKQRPQAIIVWGGLPQIFRRHLQFNIGFDRHQLSRQGELLQGLAQVVSHLALDFFSVSDKIIERSIGFQPPRCSLRAHFWHSGHVVHSVAN